MTNHDFYKINITSQHSFIDYILTVLVKKGKDVDMQNCFDMDFYVKEIYNKNIYRGFCKILYKFPTTLYKANTELFIKHYHRCLDLAVTCGTWYDVHFTHELIMPLESFNYLRPLEGKAGVYRFNKNDVPYYIGSSKNLFNRIPESIFHDESPENLTFHHIITETKEEALVIEKYYIQRLKPTKNIQHNRGERIKMDGSMPVFSEEVVFEFMPFMKALIS